MGSLHGRVALVTGGGRGLGREIALALAADGARVAVLGRTAEDVSRVAADVDGVAVVADVAAADDVGRAVAEVGASLGPVAVLVNNAGVVWPLGRTIDVDADAWEAAVRINLLGLFRVTHAVLPAMLAGGWGRVVSISSGAATAPGMPSASAYSVSKAGVEMLTAALARELSGTGVTVNAVRPGVLDTPMQDYMRSLPRDVVGPAFHDRFHGLHERGELVDPGVPATLVARLVATERTGEVIDARSEAGRALLGR